MMPKGARAETAASQTKERCGEGRSHRIGASRPSSDGRNELVDARGHVTVIAMMAIGEKQNDAGSNRAKNQQAFESEDHRIG
jgi:hypothetical protein